MTELGQFFADFPLALYAAAFLTPFVQEDAAVFGTASAAVAGQGNPLLLMCVAWAGIMVSDGWKYGVGRLAKRHPWAAKIANHPKVNAVQNVVMRRLGVALIIARFMPGTRIPLYLAAGVFGAPAARFFALIGLSAALYLGACYGLFSVLGTVLGEEVRARLPYFVVPIVIVMLVIVWGGPWLLERVRRWRRRNA